MASPHTIIFCGTPAFAVPSLEALTADSAFDVKLVVTQPDRPVGRSLTPAAPPVKVAAERHGIPVIQPESFNAHMRDSRLPEANFLVVVAYGQILSQAALTFPRVAPVNVHASLLPRWRGASPIEHAILHGDRETGVTVQQIVEELDAGPILGREKTTIGARETAVELRERLSHLGADLLVRTLRAPLHPKAQPEDGITICRKLKKQDGRADPATMTAEEIDRRVRALNPWPGVVCTVEGQELKLLATSPEPVTDAIPLPCANSTTLYLVTVQSPSKKPMSGAAWMRGKR